MHCFFTSKISGLKLLKYLPESINVSSFLRKWEWEVEVPLAEDATGSEGPGLLAELRSGGEGMGASRGVPSQQNQLVGKTEILRCQDHNIKGKKARRMDARDRITLMVTF